MNCYYCHRPIVDKELADKYAIMLTFWSDMTEEDWKFGCGCWRDTLHHLWHNVSCKQRWKERWWGIEAWWRK